MKRMMTAMAAAVTCAGLSAAELPRLFGDGTHDDTAAIQARLDTGASMVYLPPPAKHYVISKALEVGSGQELRLDRFTLVRLAPKSDCHMVINRNWRTGDRRVAVTGGVWDLDNTNQSPNPHQGRFCKPPRKIECPDHFERDFFRGEIFCFDKVEDLTIKGVTMMNPTTYAIQLTRASYFLVDDVSFDFRTWNPIRLNMDGVHLDGGCHHGKISNLRGTCYDDLVAVNANDGICAAYQGDITDIDIEGVYADYCHSAVRLLSNGTNVKRITIRNVHGNFYTYAVGFTHYFPKRPRGVFDDIVVEDVFAAKVFSPEEIGVNSRVKFQPIQFQGPIDCGTIAIRNLSRDERNIPVETIGIDPKATIRHLTVRDCKMVNRLEQPIRFIVGRERVEKLTLENNDFVAAPGAWTDTGCADEGKAKPRPFVWDKIAECERYRALNPRFRQAFAFMKRPDLATLAVGRYEIEKDNCWAMIQECELTPFGDVQTTEIHGEFIDIQAPLDGPETYGLLDTKGELFQPFDAEKDYGLADRKTTPLTLQPGEFAIFFPGCGAHAPCKTLGTAEKRRKLVIKVRK